MNRIIVTKTINASTDLVFKTVADINQFSKALPHIVKVEFLSDVKLGVGTRFRETRLMNGKEMRTELEVTEFEENDHVRIVADSHGTVWDTLFTVKSDYGHTALTMMMDARTDRWVSRIINFITSGMVKRAVERDMNAVKVFCEATTIKVSSNH